MLSEEQKKKRVLEIQSILNTKGEKTYFSSAEEIRSGPAHSHLLYLYFQGASLAFVPKSAGIMVKETRNNHDCHLRPATGTDEKFNAIFSQNAIKQVRKLYSIVAGSFISLVLIIEQNFHGFGSRVVLSLCCVVRVSFHRAIIVYTFTKIEHDVRTGYCLPKANLRTNGRKNSRQMYEQTCPDQLSI